MMNITLKTQNFLLPEAAVDASGDEMHSVLSTKEMLFIAAVSLLAVGIVLGVLSWMLR